MTPDTNANKPPITRELSANEIANLIRSDGAAMVDSKLPNELFNSEWQLAVPSDDDNTFDDRGAVGFELPKSKTGIPYSPEPLAASVQFLSSYSSMKTKGKNQLIMSAPVGADHSFNQNILHRFQEPFRQIVLSLELPQEGFTTRRSGPKSTTSARFKLFLPSQQAELIFANLKNKPDAIPQLIRDLWPGTQKVTISSNDLMTFELPDNPKNLAEATEVFARM